MATNSTSNRKAPAGGRGTGRKVSHASADTGMTTVVPLARTDLPGIYRNTSGAFTDERGVPVNWSRIKEADDNRWVEAVGSVPKTPAQLMAAMAMDPRHSLEFRLNAARLAAPYTDKKMPLMIEASATVGGVDLATLGSMSTDDRKALLDLLKKAGVEP